MSRLFTSSVDARWAAVALAFLTVLPLYVMETAGTYQARLLELFLVFALITMALNIVFAHTDQLFLFTGALAGISTYTTAALVDATGVTVWLLFPVGVLAAGGLGVLVSYVAARLKMSIIVIAILTLSLQLAATEFFQGARSITGGTTGISFPGMEVPFLEEAAGLPPQVVNYYLLLVVLAVSFVLYSRMMRSRYGLAFDAIRQDEVAAESIGINVVKYKMIAGFTAAVLIGLVGPLYATAEGRVTPSAFTFQSVDVLVLIMLVLGGMRTMLGPVVGAALVILINEQLDVFGQWETAVYGLLLIVLFLYFNEGVVPKVEEYAERFELKERIRRQLDRNG